jgi:hypothetical protein
VKQFTITFFPLCVRVRVRACVHMRVRVRVLVRVCVFGTFSKVNDKQFSLSSFFIFFFVCVWGV